MATVSEGMGGGTFVGCAVGAGGVDFMGWTRETGEVGALFFWRVDEG